MLTWQTLRPLSHLPGPPATVLLLVLLPFSVELTKMLPGSRDDARVGGVDSGGSCLVMVLSLSCLEGERMLHPAPSPQSPRLLLSVFILPAFLPCFGTLRQASEEDSPTHHTAFLLSTD